jgi:hypothetical protein
MIRRRRSTLVRPILLVLIVGAIGSGVYWFTRSNGSADTSLTGTWVISNQVLETSYRSYKDDTHEFRIEVVEEAGALTGRGKQTLYNGKTARNHYPLWFTKGEVKDDQVFITYRMNGSREFGGTFTLRVDPNDPTRLKGTFTSEAARTEGTTEVRILRD